MTAIHVLLKENKLQNVFYMLSKLYKQLRNKRYSLFFFKVDIHKAFDTLSWEFLIKVMAAMGFPKKWIKWMHNCVLTSCFQIIINGLLGKMINLKREARQGDPISPLLFILAIDFISRRMTKLVEQGTWKLPFNDMRPCLLYAYDFLFFVKPEMRQIQTLKLVLSLFHKISRLSMSTEKSELLFSEYHHNYQLLLDVLDCKRGQYPFTYLGLPLSDKILPKSAYILLIHKINKRLQGWTAKQLSITRRLVLISNLNLYVSSRQNFLFPLIK